MSPLGRAYGPSRPLRPRERPLRCGDTDKEHPGGAEDYLIESKKKRKTDKRQERWEREYREKGRKLT